MHFVLSYKVKEGHPNQNQVGDRLKGILSGYDHFVYQDSFLIVKIKEREDWDIIRNKFVDVYNSLDHAFSFIMSPIITSGRYNGMMIQKDWEIINRLSISD